MPSVAGGENEIGHLLGSQPVEQRSGHDRWRFGLLVPDPAAREGHRLLGTAPFSCPDR